MGDHKRMRKKEDARGEFREMALLVELRLDHHGVVATAGRERAHTAVSRGGSGPQAENERGEETSTTRRAPWGIILVGGTVHGPSGGLERGLEDASSGISLRKAAATDLLVRRPMLYWIVADHV